MRPAILYVLTAGIDGIYMHNVTLSLARSLLYPVSETLIPRDRHEAMMCVPKAGCSRICYFSGGAEKEEKFEWRRLLY